MSLFRFTLKETCEIFKDFTDNINKARILSLVSTYPYYLSFVDFSKDYLTNVFELFYEEESPFSRYPESIITTNVVYTGYYSSIIKEISLGNYTYESLIKALKIESSTLSKYLNELIDLQTIKPRYKFLTSKGILYEINDPILAFYFRFIRNNADIIKQGGGKLLFEQQKNSIIDFINHRFEFLSMDYLSYLNLEGKLSTFYTTFYHYNVEKPKLNRSVEIDCCAESSDTLLIGECKFTNKKRGLKDYYDMLEDISVPPFEKYHNKELYLISANGFEEGLINIQDKRLHLIDIDKMLNIGKN